MENIYYIHDASTNILVVHEFRGATDETIEDRVMHQADYHGMHWGSCSWGGVNTIKMDVNW